MRWKDRHSLISDAALARTNTVSDSVDQEQTARNVQSDLDLHYLQRN